MKATRAQIAVLDGWRLRCSELYNAALQQRREAWARQRVSVSRFAQTKDLTELREAMREWREIPSDIARSALTRLDLAFAAFFRRIRSGEKPGYPRFRSRYRYDSFGVGRVRVEQGRVQVPKLGWVRFHCYRPLGGAVRNVEIRRTAKRWWVCVACDVGEAPPKRVVKTATGIDLGLKEFAVLANGDAIHNPRHFLSGEDVLARRQRNLATKQRGSNRRAKARNLVGLAHERVRNQRLDFHRKVAADLCGRYDLIAHEALNVKGLARGFLAKSVNDAGWSQFLAILGSKAESAGCHVVAVDPRYTTQTCADCGLIVPKSLSERVHACECGAVRDRDHNAAIVIEARGRRALGLSSEVPGESRN